ELEREADLVLDAREHRRVVRPERGDDRDAGAVLDPGRRRAGLELERPRGLEEGDRLAARAGVGTVDARLGRVDEDGVDRRDARADRARGVELLAVAGHLTDRRAG